MRPELAAEMTEHLLTDGGVTNGINHAGHDALFDDNFFAG